VEDSQLQDVLDGLCSPHHMWLLLQTLVDFQFVEPNGKDQGINVRKKAQTLIALVNDKEKIREAREKAQKNRDK
jgi:hypothetical protein